MCCSQYTCKRPRWDSNLSSLAPQPWSWPFTTGFTTTASWHSHRMRFSFKSTFLLSSQCVSFILPTTLKKQVGDIQHLYFTHNKMEAARTRLTNSYLDNQTPVFWSLCLSSLVWANILNRCWQHVQTWVVQKRLSHTRVRSPQWITITKAVSVGLTT